MPQVRLDGGLRNEQVLGDLPVRQPVRGQRGYPPFGAGQRVRAGERGAAGAGAGREQFLPRTVGQRQRAGALGEVQGAAQRRPRLLGVPGPPQLAALVEQGAGQVVPGPGGFQQGDRFSQVVTGLLADGGGVRPQRDPDRAWRADPPGQGQLLAGQRRRGGWVTARGVHGGGIGAPGGERRVLHAEREPAGPGCGEILQRFPVAVLGGPQPAAGLPEQDRVDPACWWIALCGDGGHHVRVTEPAQGSQRLDAERRGPGDGDRRRGSELEVERQLAVLGGVFQVPEPAHEHGP